METNNSPICPASSFLKLLFPLLFFFSLTVTAFADNRTVLVGLYESKPDIFISESGNPEGIFVDVIEQIAKSEGWILRYVPGTWVEGLERLEKGEIDIVGGIGPTDERQKRFSFNKVPVTTSWSRVYAAKGSEIVTILDLKGKRLAAVAGSIHEEGFIRFIKGSGLDITIIPVLDHNIAFETVAKGDADAAVTYDQAGPGYKEKHRLEDTAIIFNPTTGNYATTKYDPKQLLDAIDKHLVAMRGNPDSVYHKTLKRWTAKEGESKLPQWAKITGLVVLAFLVLSLVGSVVLQRQVKARTLRATQSAAAMEKAQEADRIKSAFLATMSHELRTPLNSILGFTGILLKGLAGELNPEQHKQLTMVQASSRHLLTLINDILDISKIEAGQLVLDCTDFNLRLAVEDMNM